MLEVDMAFAAAQANLTYPNLAQNKQHLTPHQLAACEAPENLLTNPQHYRKLSLQGLVFAMTRFDSFEDFIACFDKAADPAMAKEEVMHLFKRFVRDREFNIAKLHPICCRLILTCFPNDCFSTEKITELSSLYQNEPIIYQKLQEQKPHREYFECLLNDDYYQENYQLTRRDFRKILINDKSFLSKVLSTQEGIKLILARNLIPLLTLRHGDVVAERILQTNPDFIKEILNGTLRWPIRYVGPVLEGLLDNEKICQLILNSELASRLSPYQLNHVRSKFENNAEIQQLFAKGTKLRQQADYCIKEQRTDAGYHAAKHARVDSYSVYQLIDMSKAETFSDILSFPALANQFGTRLGDLLAKEPNEIQKLDMHPELLEFLYYSSENPLLIVNFSITHRQFFEYALKHPRLSRLYDGRALAHCLKQYPSFQAINTVWNNQELREKLLNADELKDIEPCKIDDYAFNLTEYNIRPDQYESFFGELLKICADCFEHDESREQIMGIFKHLTPWEQYEFLFHFLRVNTESLDGKGIDTKKHLEHLVLNHLSQRYNIFTRSVLPAIGFFALTALTIMYYQAASLLLIASLIAAGTAITINAYHRTQSIPKIREALFQTFLNDPTYPWVQDSSQFKHDKDADYQAKRLGYDSYLNWTSYLGSFFSPDGYSRGYTEGEAKAMYDSQFIPPMT